MSRAGTQHHIICKHANFRISSYLLIVSRAFLVNRNHSKGTWEEIFYTTKPQFRRYYQVGDPFLLEYEFILDDISISVLIDQPNQYEVHILRCFDEKFGLMFLRKEHDEDEVNMYKGGIIQSIEIYERSRFCDYMNRLPITIRYREDIMTVFRLTHAFTYKNNLLQFIVDLFRFVYDKNT